MSDTLYGITHLFFPSTQRRNPYTVALTILGIHWKHTPFSSTPPGEALKKSNFFRTNDYKALHSQLTPSSVSSPGEALQKSKLFYND